MPTEPREPSLAEVVRRAVEACDPAGEDEALAGFLEEFEDRDEPITSVEDIEAVTARATGAAEADAADAPLVMAAAVVDYLRFKQQALGRADEDLLRLAARSEFDGAPPRAVADWLERRGVSL